MKSVLLIATLLLTPGLIFATFELEDPAAPGKEDIEPREKPIFGFGKDDSDVIVAPNTELFTLTVESRECSGWQPDASEPSPLDANQTQHTTATTYLGKVLSTLSCDNGMQQKVFSLVQTREGRMLWVESDKVLSVD